MRSSSKQNHQNEGRNGKVRHPAQSSPTALERILAAVPEPQRIEASRRLHELAQNPDDPFYILFATILADAEKSRTAGITALRADLKPQTAELQKIGKALFTTGFVRRAILGRLALWLAMTATTVILTLWGINYLSGQQVNAIAPYIKNQNTLEAFTKSLDETNKLNRSAQKTAIAILAVSALLNTPDINIAKIAGSDKWIIWGRGLTVGKSDTGEEAVELKNNTLDDFVEMDLFRQKIEPARDALQKAETLRQP